MHRAILHGFGLVLAGLYDYCCTAPRRRCFCSAEPVFFCSCMIYLYTERACCVLVSVYRAIAYDKPLQVCLPPVCNVFLSLVRIRVALLRNQRNKALSSHTFQGSCAGFCFVLCRVDNSSVVSKKLLPAICADLVSMSVVRDSRYQ